MVFRFKCYNLQYCPKNYFGWLSEGTQNYRLQLGILFGDTAIQTFCFMYCVFVLAAKMVNLKYNICTLYTIRGLKLAILINWDLIFQWRGNDFSTGWSRPTFSSWGSGAL